MKILYFGTVCDLDNYEKILKKCKDKPTVATVIFESALLKGFYQNGADIDIVAYPMIPVWPHSPYLCWGNKKEQLSCGYTCTWLRTGNVMFLKQFTRVLDGRRILKRWLKKNCGEDRQVLTYGIAPFLVKDIISLCKKNRVKCSAIVPDLPKDMYINSSQHNWKAKLRKIYLRPALRFQGEFDQYIYLTEAMSEVINIQKPYMVMEGILDVSYLPLEEDIPKLTPRGIMYAGGLNVKYGIMNLIDAFEEAKIPNTELWLFGDGNAVGEIQARADRNAHIRFFGRRSREEVLTYERKATLLVNPRSSREEYTKYSFPSKTIEYMSTGTPLLTTRLPGIPEEYFKYVFSAEDNDMDTLAKALTEALSLSDEAMQEMGNRAREFVITQKNAEAQSRRILSFLEASNSVLPKVLFMTNIPSPYRIDFFNLFGRQCDLTVAFERRYATNRDTRWEKYEAKHFKEIYASVKPWRHEQSKGNGLVKLIRENHYDIIIFSGYGSPSVRRAIAYCRRKKIPYYIEYDGAFNKKDPGHKYIAKKYLVKEAKGHFITCQELEDYLTRLSVPKERLLKYPFSSLNESDILPVPLSPEEKKSLKAELGIHSSCAILSVGQFIPRKGFDILMKAVAAMKQECDIYIIGGKPSLKYEQLKEKLGLDRLHFVDFLSKEELKRWYRACDIFVLPTREDIWGLVVNEAMANSLPVIATDRCIAALELIESGKNGYVVPVEDEIALAEKLDILVENPQLRTRMGEANLEKIRAYTIENMAEAHISHLKRIEKL